jgi:hypothetical protein
MLNNLLLVKKKEKKKGYWFRDIPEHVDSENIKFLIGRRSYLYQLLKKRDFYFINVAKIGKNGPNMEFFDFFEIANFLM